MRPLKSYSSIVFDCDGVLLDSNQIKSDCFRSVALPWGVDSANALYSYHLDNGGVSRYLKFSYFFEKILPNYVPNARPGIDGPDYEQLLENYSALVWDQLMSCSVARGIDSLKKLSPYSSWSIASGGDQVELRQLFDARGLIHYFDGGIFGSPDSKDVILSRAIQHSIIRFPALFLGDSKYDYEAATKVGIDFLFVSDWTDVEDWRQWVSSNGIPHVRSIAHMLLL